MPIIVPDLTWYKQKSIEAKVPPECPYSNVHKCYRYYASLYMLGQARMITSMSDEKITELDTYWKKSELFPVIEEEDTGTSGCENKVSTFSNFCPEVSFTYLSYYADYLTEYADYIDKDVGCSIAKRENIDNDWRFYWARVNATHYLDCNVYNRVKKFNSKPKNKFDDSVHENIIILIKRMEICLENKDCSGVIHASANIFETMAKDIIDSGNIENQTLGSFIGKFNNESKLPENFKTVVKEIYLLRNKSPISGHGSTKPSQVSMEDAIVIAALTKSIVEIEYRARTI
ncbi:hypothetical protein ACOHYD_13610 [Desulfobacterota bacterium M19]